MAGRIASAVVRVLTDGDPEVCELADLYQAAARVLDRAGVPYAPATPDAEGVPPEMFEPLDLAGRILWLARQRPTGLELRRVASERDRLEAQQRDAAFARARAPDPASGAKASLAEDRVLTFVASRLESMLHRPGIWGSLLSVEERILQLLELRRVLPRGNPDRRETNLRGESGRSAGRTHAPRVR